jgi:hypothetical protein
MSCPSSTSVDLGARVSEPCATLLMSSAGQQGGRGAGGRRKHMAYGAARSALQQLGLATSQPDSRIIIAGDFNAKVGQEQALSIPAAAAIVA